jgi:hypothetical protein
MLPDTGPRSGNWRADLRGVLDVCAEWIGFVKGFAGEAAQVDGYIAGQRSVLAVLDDMRRGIESAYLF